MMKKIFSTILAVSLVVCCQAQTHEAVDLGLSVKWATCNVGATSPQELGGLYGWGDVSGQ